VAAWPTVAQVKRRLGITNSDAGVTADVTLALNAAIEQVKLDTGGGAVWDPEEGDPPDPTDSLSAAALLLTVACYKAPDAPHGVAAIFDMGGIYVARQNPHYDRLLVGSRYFGIG
jgi:hypothetical protein